MRINKILTLCLNLVVCLAVYNLMPSKLMAASNSAINGYNAIPNGVPGKPYQYLNLSATSDSSTAGAGAAIYDSYLKLYTADANRAANSHVITFAFTNINNASECNRYKIQITGYPLPPNEDFTGAYNVSGNSAPTGGFKIKDLYFGEDAGKINICKTSGATTFISIDVTNVFNFDKPSTVTQHKDLYTGVIRLFLSETTDTRAVSYFNVYTDNNAIDYPSGTSNVKVGLLGGRRSAIYPHPRGPADYNPYKLEWYFGTQCDVNRTDQSSIPSIRWGDDDYGSPIQPVGSSFNMQIIKKIAGVESELANLMATPVENGYKYFRYTSWDPNIDYILRFSNVYGNNGIEAIAPFDSGDFYFPCSQTFNTSGTATITENAGSVDENPTSVKLRAVVNREGGETEAPVQDMRLKLVKRVGSVDTTIPGTEHTSDPLTWVGTQREIEFDYNFGGNSARESDWDVGDKACAVLTWKYKKGVVVPGDITSVTPDPGKEYGSSDSCITITNQPYVSVYGNDVSAGGGFAPCGVNNNAKIEAYTKKGGSSTQLAAFALGDIDGFKSAFLRPTGSPPTVPKGLSFGNTSGTFGGKYGVLNCTPDYWNSVAFPEGSDKRSPLVNTGVIPLNANAFLKDNKQTFAKSFSGTVRLLDGENFNKKATLFVDGDVIISDNITYANTGAWSTISDIPYFSLVVKGNIYINKNVREISGFYIAQPKEDGSGGNIYTCSDDDRPYNSNSNFSNCKAQLVINGAFVAKKVHFLRSYKTISDGVAAESSASSNASELFRFSPEMYLAQPLFRPSSSVESGEYDYITTLPPIL